MSATEFQGVLLLAAVLPVMGGWLVTFLFELYDDYRESK